MDEFEVEGRGDNLLAAPNFPSVAKPADAASTRADLASFLQALRGVHDGSVTEQEISRGRLSHAQAA
jgi:hypothetical protein